MRDYLDRETLYDVIVVGGGPAGLTAALYLARGKRRVLVLEAEGFGGQIAATREVLNYPGVERVDGRELTETMRRQAESFGAEFLLARVEGLDLTGEVKTVRTDRGELRCLGVLLATGARPRPAGFRGEETYRGRGVSYCAACDGQLFTDREVFVVGGGYAAAEEGVFLARFARHVTILIRREDFSCAPTVADRARKHEKITVRVNTEVEEVSGTAGVERLRCRDTVTGEQVEFQAGTGEHFGVFVLAGRAPASELARDWAELDEQGYVRTDADKKTRTEGLYAAGDVCVKPLRQVVTAVGDGALAAAGLEQYAASMRRRGGPDGEKR